jgi:hypothetical protein
MASRGRRVLAAEPEANKSSKEAHATKCTLSVTHFQPLAC